MFFQRPPEYLELIRTAFPFVPLLQIGPEYFVVAGNLERLLPALRVVLKIPPQQPVLYRVRGTVEAKCAGRSLLSLPPACLQ